MLFTVLNEKSDRFMGMNRYSDVFAQFEIDFPAEKPDVLSIPEPSKSLKFSTSVMMVNNIELFQEKFELMNDYRLLWITPAR